MAYVATSFVFGEQPSAAKWNQLGGNDAAFNAGTGFAAGALGADIASVAAGHVVQYVYNTTDVATLQSGGTAIPNDNTIPQNTEGNQFMTLAITPKASTNILNISIGAYVSPAGAAADMIGAIFQDSTANALMASTVRQATADGQNIITLQYSMVAGTTSSTTFKFRAGRGTAATVYFNGNAGAQAFSTIPKSWFTITEIKA